METSSTKPAGEPPEVRRPKKPGFGAVGFALVVALLSSVALQTLVEAVSGLEATPLELAAIAAGGMLLAAAALFASRQRIYRYLASADAAVVVLLALMLMTVVGTLIHQGADEPTFRARYPLTASVWLALHVDDVFHSLPFALLLVLLAVSSAITVVRRRTSFKKWRHFGLLVSHVSVLAILLGGLIGSAFGGRGKMRLEVGESRGAFDTMPRGSRPSEVEELGFTVRLDRFDLDRFEPEFEFYTYEAVPGADGWRLVAVEEPRLGETVGRPRGDRAPTATVSKLFLSGTLERAGDDRHRLTRRSGEQQEVVVGQTVALGAGATAKIKRYYPDFVLDERTGRPSSRTDAPNNPVLEVERVDASGHTSTQHLYGRKAMRRRHAPAAPDLTYDRIAGPVALVESLGDVTPNPAVEVTLRWPDGKTERAVRFAATAMPIELGAGRYLVFRERPQAIRSTRSRLTVVQDGRETVTHEVAVNEPLYVGKYAFYQAKADSDTASYSVIEVVSDPGLGLVTGGLWSLLVGVLHTVALRGSRPRWWRGAARPQGAAGPDSEGAP